MNLFLLIVGEGFGVYSCRTAITYCQWLKCFRYNLWNKELTA